ncbi:MAG: hypothetical protein KTR30_03660, partial [Saprospiraceae bacterium]|nr:hypothetical protein [Saprospiraceae bacterium]
SSGSANTSERLFDLLGGTAFDSQGNLYVAHTTGRQILKIDPAGMVESLNHTGVKLVRPDGIYINAKDEIFVADRQTGGIVKILPNGESSVVATTQSGVRGLTGDEAGNLYASINREEGLIFKITPDGQSEQFAQIPTFVPPDYVPRFAMWVGYLTYHQGDVYVAGVSTHRIYKINDTGEVTVFAGSGTKLLPEGDALTAPFNRPMGLAFSPDGTRLFVSGCLDVTPQHVQASRPSRVYQIELN